MSFDVSPAPPLCCPLPSVAPTDNGVGFTSLAKVREQKLSHAMRASRFCLGKAARTADTIPREDSPAPVQPVLPLRVFDHRFHWQIPASLRR